VSLLSSPLSATKTRLNSLSLLLPRRSSRNPIFFLLNALTMALGNVNAAPVRLNALLVENVRLSLPSLQGRIILHYSNQFTAQLYRILGSADMFGNPVGLFNNVSSGVHDIFYEPYQGFVLHGNKELASGIARVSRVSLLLPFNSNSFLNPLLHIFQGATSFVKKTVFGVSDSIAKVTGSIGKGESSFSTRRVLFLFFPPANESSFLRYLCCDPRPRVPGSSANGSASEQAQACFVSRPAFFVHS